MSLFMNKFIILTLVLLLLGCGEQETYTASDCITRIEFKWQNETEREKARVTTEFMDSFIRQYIVINGTDSPPPSSAVQGSEREFVFLQYTANCDDKAELTKSITSEVLLGSSYLPKVLFTGESFEPGYETILVEGPYWKSD